MDFYNRALHGKTARGRMARKIEPSLKPNDYSRVNKIFSKGSLSMVDVEDIVSLMERKDETLFQSA